MATITYSQITLITQVPDPSYINQAIPIRILVGSNEAVYSPNSYTYQWAQSVTPSLTSVSPNSMSGPQTLTLTGQNFPTSGSITTSDVTVTINGQSCVVTAVTGSTITCNIGSIQAGNHAIAVLINGMTLFDYGKDENTVFCL